MVARRFGMPVPETRASSGGPDRKEREELLALLEAAAAALHAQPLDGAGHEGARVPARPRLQEGDAGADPRRRRAATPGATCSTRCGRTLPAGRC